MKLKAGVWRLSDVGVDLHVPLTTGDFSSR